MTRVATVYALTFTVFADQYRMRGNVRGTKFSRFSRTAWSSAKVKSANYCGTRDNVVIIKWPTRRAVQCTLTLPIMTTIEQRDQ